RWLPLALPFAVPFSFAGLMLSALLAAPTLSTRRVYFFDLLGSAAGALAVVPVIGTVGVEYGLLSASALLVGGTVALLPPRGRAARGLAGAAALVLVLAFAKPGRVCDLYYPEGSLLAATRDPASGISLEHVAWDSVARIEVSRVPAPRPETFPYPVLIGSNRTFHERFRRVLTQNNYA